MSRSGTLVAYGSKDPLPISFSTQRPVLALILFVALLAAGLFTVIEHSSSGLNRAVTGLESWVVVSAAIVYVALEGWEIIVLAARYRRMLKDEGRAEGLAEGLARGRQDQQNRWEAWERASQQARDEGKDPPPMPEL